MGNTAIFQELSKANSDVSGRSAEEKVRLVGLVGLALVALLLPFELEDFTLGIGTFRLTNLELALVLTLGLTLLLVVVEKRWRVTGWTRYPKSWLLLWATFALFMALSALLAPEQRLNALKATSRTIGGLGLALATPQLIHNRKAFQWIVGALLVGGMAAAAAGLAEFAAGKAIPLLDLFRIKATVVGPFLRLSSTFNHANQAAMFFEATIPLMVATCWALVQKKRRRLGIMVSLACLLTIEASLLTFSRASFVTIFLSNAAIGILLLGRPIARARLARPWLLTALVLALLLVLNVMSSPVLRLRLTTEGDNEWYRLAFDVPAQLSAAAGDTLEVPVNIENMGALTWSSAADIPISLGARWYETESGTMVFSELRWPLSEDVSPGSGIKMNVPLTVPDFEGEYWLEWDLVQENVIWFSAKNGQRFRSFVVIEQGAPAATIDNESSMAQDMANSAVDEPVVLAEPIPDRRTLWSAAGNLLRERPLLGVGLDNYRLIYGDALDLRVWNKTIHTNNWYIETLVSLGILGSLPFFSWLLLMLIDIIRKIKRAARENVGDMWQIALGIGLVAFMIHGLLDYFLMFNGTGLLFWMLVGLWQAQYTIVSKQE